MCSLYFILLIISHWFLLTPTSASAAPFSPPEPHTSRLPCPSSFLPPQPLSLVSGLACLCLGGGLEGMTWASRWKEGQRPIRGQRVRGAASPLVAEEIIHVFISPSHPLQSTRLSFPHARGGEQRVRGGRRRREGGIRVSVCAFECAFTCVCLHVACKHLEGTEGWTRRR